MGNASAGERDGADARALMNAPYADQPAEEPSAQAFAGKPRGRTCTDPLCTLIFLLFLGCMVWICAYAQRHGDMRKLTSGIDWQGRLCGVGEGVETKPYLYWCHKGDLVGAVPNDVETDFPICVGSCPEGTGGTVQCPQQPDEDKQTQVTFNTQQGTDIVTVLTVTQTTKELSTYPTRLVGYRYCLPAQAIDFDGIEGVADQIRDSLYVDKAVGLLHDIGSLWHVGNIIIFLIVLIGAVVANFMYLVLVRYCAKVALLLCLATCVGFLIALGICMIILGLQPDGLDPTGTVAEPLFEFFSQSIAVEASVGIGAALIIVGLVLAIVTCCAKDTIDVAVGCLQVAAKVIWGMPPILLQPIFCAFFKVTLLAVLIYYFLNLVACGELAQNSIDIGTVAVSGLNRTITYTTEQKYMLCLFAFGIVWLMEVCNAFETYIIAYATVRWYYKPKEEDGSKGLVLLPGLRGFIYGLVFHTGTLSLGAFLIALVRGMQFIMYLVDKQADEQDNRVGQCIARSCLCCLDCFKECLAGINKNAYIHTAIYSTDFCPSAMRALDFISRHLSEITVLNGATFIAQLVGTGSITACGALFSWIALKEGYVTQHNVLNYDLAACVGGALCLAVSSVFMMLLDDVSDTLLYTYSDNKNTDLSSVPMFAPDDLSDLVDAQRDKHDALHERRRGARTLSFQ